MITTQTLDQFFKWGILLFVGSIIFSTPLVQGIVLLLTVVWIAKQWTLQPRQIKRTPFDVQFLAFVLARVLSIPFSVNPSLSIAGLYKEIIFYGIFFVVTHEFTIEDRKHVKTVLWVLVGSAIVASVYGSTNFILGITERAMSTASGPMTLGMYLTAVLGIWLFLGRNKELVPNRALWLLSCALLMVGIVCTMNRIHWALMGLVVLAVGMKKERRLLLILGIVALVALAIPALHQRIIDRLTSSVGFLTERDVIWKAAWNLAFERPMVGFGLRTFPEIFPSFDQLIDKRVGSWHNDYVQVYMESGLVGLLSFLWLVVTIFAKGIQALKNLEPFFRDLLLGLLTSMSLFFLSGLVGGFIIDPLTSLLFRFELALIALLVTLSAVKGQGMATHL